MQHTLLSQKDFIEKYKSGERFFSNIILQFSYFSDMNFSDITIKNSKILSCTFRSCDIKNVKFEDCEFFYAGFYNSKMIDTVFEKCKIEISVFENMEFNKSKLHKCYLRAVGILWSNNASLDITTSTQHLVITDPSQLTPKDLDSLVSDIIAFVGRQDILVRMEMKASIQRQIDRYKLKENTKEGTYASEEQNYENGPLTYGMVKSLVEATFGVYGPQIPYKMKKTPYNKDGQYK